METKCYCGHTTRCDCGPESLEEVSEKYVEIYRCPATNDNEYCRHDIISAINFGAKWQQEQILDFLYSEITERRDYSASKMCEKVIEFIGGAKWQQERSYSEDDMIEFGKFMLLENHEYKSYQNIFNEWVKQFKKK